MNQYDAMFNISQEQLIILLKAGTTNFKWWLDNIIQLYTHSLQIYLERTRGHERYAKTTFSWQKKLKRREPRCIKLLKREFIQHSI